MFVLRYVLLALTALAFLGSVAFNVRLYFLPMRNAPIGIGMAFIFAGVALLVTGVLFGLMLLSFKLKWWQGLPINRTQEWLIVVIAFVGVGGWQIVKQVQQMRQAAYFDSARSDEWNGESDAVVLKGLANVDRQDWVTDSRNEHTLANRLGVNCGPLTAERVETITGLVSAFSDTRRVCYVVQSTSVCPTHPELREAHLSLVLSLLAPKLNDDLPTFVTEFVNALPDPAWAMGVLVANGYRAPVVK